MFCAAFLADTEPQRHLGAAGTGLLCSQVVWGREPRYKDLWWPKGEKGLVWEGPWLPGVPYLEDTSPAWNPSRFLCLRQNLGSQGPLKA